MRVPHASFEVAPELTRVSCSVPRCEIVEGHGGVPSGFSRMSLLWDPSCRVASSFSRKIAERGSFLSSGFRLQPEAPRWRSDAELKVQDAAVLRRTGGAQLARYAGVEQRRCARAGGGRGNRLVRGAGRLEDGVTCRCRPIEEVGEPARRERRGGRGDREYQQQDAAQPRERAGGGCHPGSGQCSRLAAAARQQLLACGTGRASCISSSR